MRSGGRDNEWTKGAGTEVVMYDHVMGEHTTLSGDIACGKENYDGRCPHFKGRG